MLNRKELFIDCPDDRHKFSLSIDEDGDIMLNHYRKSDIVEDLFYDGYELISGYEAIKIKQWIEENFNA